ncbi:MAG TPA: hypothetical protein PKA88_33450, partial [Polyangiaceae bacterium]|nr:hypothetical protein [Polyangiaceae bacterium]
GGRLGSGPAGRPASTEAALLGAFPKDPVAFDALNMYFGGVHLAHAHLGVLGGAGDPRRGGCVRVV